MIKEGQLVRLKSGGPDMVVERIFERSLDSNGVISIVKYAACSWMNEKNEKQVEDFAFPALEIIGE
uniref:DUF2158 domain-containing protein n=1 Tax=Salmonella phage vB_SEnST11_KE23 TaxID=3161174 RepID=A0AAU8GIS0_9CAUD